MKPYLSFFRLRLQTGLQYRAAALAGVFTQFFWGLLEILAFQAFYRGDPSAFPMEFSALVSYVWMQQAFLAFFMVWLMEQELFDAIQKGDVAYQLCRPWGIYDMWFARTAAYRLSRGLLRCFPILIVAAFLPMPYRLLLPQSPERFLLFLLTMVLAFLVVVSFCVAVYFITFFTISPQGLRIMVVTLAEFCQGALIPLPFFPGWLQKILELSPFGAMQNVPLRIYSGDIAGMDALAAALLQLFWLVVLWGVGKWLEKKALAKMIMLGG